MTKRFVHDPIPLKEDAHTSYPNLVPFSATLDMLGIKKSVFYAERSLGRYPFAAFRVHGRIHYNANEIAAWINAGEPTADEGWEWNSEPLPAYVFSFAEDYERQFSRNSR